MEALSSSFLSPFPQPQLHSASISSSRLIPLLFHVSSVRIEDKPKAATVPRKLQTPSRISLPPPPLATAVKNNPAPPPLSTFAMILNVVEDFINKTIDPPNRPSVDPKHVLSNNFSPVDELPPTPCTVVEGALPSCLDGAYIRNGPNPQFFPLGPYHMFDGDGMLHVIKISDGKATLCSRYVKTYKYVTERSAGYSVFPNIFSGFNSLAASAARTALFAARIVSGQVNISNGFGLANTSLAMIGGKLFALGESDLPYEIKVSPNGDVVTIGRHNFSGELKISMTAHPKLDPGTGETFAFKYRPMPPFLTFFRVNPDGTKQPDVPIFSMKRPALLHDFALTKKYAIFPEIQMEMNPVNMISGRPPVCMDLGAVPRLGVIPRYAKDESEMRWFDVPGLNIMHAINAWDEDNGDTIVIVAPNILSAEHTLDRMDLVHASVEMIKINMRTNIVWRHPISTRNLDFGVINPAFLGNKNRFVYAAIAAPMPKVSGVAKLDLLVLEDDRRDCIVASRMFGLGCFGGEPFFVAKDPGKCNAEEDDGYVISYVHDENKGESRLIIMDAKSPNLEIIAVVNLPNRVPYGFHGLFVRESYLNKL